MSTPEQDALAKKRFLALQLVRLTGIAMILVGLLFALDRVDVPQPPRHIIGVMLVLFGLIDTFLVPPMLAKRWKS